MSDWVDPEELARAWHWSKTAPVHRVSHSDPDLPETLIACGLWTSMTLQIPRQGTRVLSCDDRRAYLAFDPESDEGRLYLVLPASVRTTARSAFWRDGARTVSLSRLAESVGGSQQGGYPDVDVQPIGKIVTVEYYAKKYGQNAQNGAVWYHDHDSHPQPWLAVSEDGRLFYAGGDYDGSDLRGIVG